MKKCRPWSLDGYEFVSTLSIGRSQINHYYFSTQGWLFFSKSSFSLWVVLLLLLLDAVLGAKKLMLDGVGESRKKKLCTRYLNSKLTDHFASSNSCRDSLGLEGSHGHLSCRQPSVLDKEGEDSVNTGCGSLPLILVLPLILCAFEDHIMGVSPLDLNSI